MNAAQAQDVINLLNSIDSKLGCVVLGMFFLVVFK